VETRVCRWGILGTAGIARKNWQAIALAGNATVTAVASRRLERSRQFVAECQAACPLPNAPVAVGGYEELLARRDVDAVYARSPRAERVGVRPPKPASTSSSRSRSASPPATFATCSPPAIATACSSWTA
jgi:hypothetical protein